MSDAGTGLLVVAGITKQFGGIVALDHVDLEVAAGEAVGVVGPNGAGKTTLFNCVFGLETPDEGTVVFDGRRIDRMAVWTPQPAWASDAPSSAWSCSRG